MTTKTVRAGKTVTGGGTVGAGDILQLLGGAAGGGTGATAIVTGTLADAGTIRIQGGAANANAAGAGGQGALLEVVGVLTDFGAIVLQAGSAGISTAAAGGGGRLVVSGTLAVQAAGSITLQGGTANGTSPLGVTGSANGGALTNAGLLQNAGTITLDGGDFGGHYGPRGLGSVLDNSGTLANTGTIVVMGGLSGFEVSSGGGATLADTGVLTNAGAIELGGGAGGDYLATSAYGGTLAVLGMLTSTGTITVDGGGTAGSYSGAGHGGLLQVGGGLENDGTIHIEAGRTGSGVYLGYGGQLVDAGLLVNNGAIQIDGSQPSYYPAASAGTATVTGQMTSYGQIAISGGNGASRFDGRDGQGGVLVDRGSVALFKGIVVGGGAASAAARYTGGYGGTLSVEAGGNLTSFGGETVTIQGGAGAAVSGKGAGGLGGVLDIAGVATTYGALVLQAGSPGQAGDASGGGASMVLSGELFCAGPLMVAGGPGAASASVTLTSTAMLVEDTSLSTIENGGVIVLQAGATITSFGGGNVHNTGSIGEAAGAGGAATLSSLSVVNDGTIDSGSGALLLSGDTLTADTGASGVLKAGLGGTLTLSGGSIDASQTVVLAGTGATLSATAGNAAVLIRSAMGGTLQITGGGIAVLNTADRNLSVFLSAATNLTLGRMGAVAAIGSAGADTITALAAGQTLTGGSGADMLAGSAATGDVFKDTAAGLNGDTIAGFAGTDTIDVTDFLPGAGLALGYTQQGAAGKLTLSEGSASTTITLQGQFTAGAFTTTSDLHGGVLIGLHG